MQANNNDNAKLVIVKKSIVLVATLKYVFHNSIAINFIFLCVVTFLSLFTALIKILYMVSFKGDKTAAKEKDDSQEIVKE